MLSGAVINAAQPRSRIEGMPESSQAGRMTRPTIRKGDYGSDVRLVQECLNAEPIDGDFGPITEDAVEEFQVEHRLSVDGVVGPQTWGALDEEFSLPPYPPPMLPRLPADIKTKIENVAADSNIADFIWKDRGTAPIGYTQGMALAYATVLRKFHRGDGAVHEMARADKGHSKTDALAFYRDEFQKKGMDNSKPGINTLRHLFVMLMGLGMRESSGRHCEGRLGHGKDFSRQRSSVPDRSSNGPPHRSPGYRGRRAETQRRCPSEGRSNSRAASHRRHDREGRVVGANRSRTGRGA
jgi:Putative peptidoglycan binding domain